MRLRMHHAVQGEKLVSAAFALDFSGPPVPCDFPGCVLDAFHDGDHQRAPKSGPIAWTYDRHCVVCGVPFTVLGAERKQIFDTCGSQQCLQHYARHHASDVPIFCSCAQRPYPHELSVHRKLYEAPGGYMLYEDVRAQFASEEMRWPWSLRFAPKMED
jgi:hypothetical protein